MTRQPTNFEGNMGTWKQVLVIEVWPATSVKGGTFPICLLESTGFSVYILPTTNVAPENASFREGNLNY